MSSSDQCYEELKKSLKKKRPDFSRTRRDRPPDNILSIDKDLNLVGIIFPRPTLQKNLVQYFVSEKELSDFRRAMRWSSIYGPQEVEITLKLPYSPGPVSKFWCQVFTAFDLHVIFVWEIAPKLIIIPPSYKALVISCSGI
jgi:hypothetical protein